MPASKNAVKRYMIINRCLSGKGKKYFSTEDLMEKIAKEDIRINARTLRYDLEAMRHDDTLGYFAPIAFCKTNRGYHYTDADYSIEAINLTQEQLQSLDFVVNALHEYQDLQVMKEFHGVIDKLAGVFRQLTRGIGTTFIEYETAPYYKGLELRDQILHAIRNREVLAIHYTTFGRSYPIKHILHPYLLKEYKNRWYLIGLLNSKTKPITLALDRMDGISTVAIRYLENTYFDPKAYFKNFLGITCTQGEIEEIVLKISPSLSNYIKTQHLHASQQIITESEDGLLVTLQLIINYELIALILSHGKDIMVIKPQVLKDQVKQKLLESLQQYDVN